MLLDISRWTSPCGGKFSNQDFDEHLEIFTIMETKGFQVIRKGLETRGFLPNGDDVLFGREKQRRP